MKHRYNLTLRILGTIAMGLIFIGMGMYHLALAIVEGIIIFSTGMILGSIIYWIMDEQDLKQQKVNQ